MVHSNPSDSPSKGDLKLGWAEGDIGYSDCQDNPRYVGIHKKPVLSITSSGEIGFREHDIEASKMQGRARGRKGERKTYYITISPWNLEDIF